MADDKHDLNQDRNTGAGNRDKQGDGQQAPGRDANDELSMGKRPDHQQNSNREFDREDRDREQPGSKQRDPGNV